MYVTEGVVGVCVCINSKIRGHYFIWQLVVGVCLYKHQNTGELFYLATRGRGMSL